MFFLRARRPLPPPMVVDIGGVNRIHQPDHGMIDIATKRLDLGPAGLGVGDRRCGAARISALRFSRRHRPRAVHPARARDNAVRGSSRDRDPGPPPAREWRCKPRRGGSASRDRGTGPCSPTGFSQPTAARRDGDKCRAWRKPGRRACGPAAPARPAAFRGASGPASGWTPAPAYTRGRAGAPPSAAINWGRRKRCRAAGRVAFPVRPPWSSARRASSSKAAPCPATAYRPIRPRAH